MLNIYILITRFLILLSMLIPKIGFHQYIRSFSLSRNKRYKSNTIHWKKLRNCDVIKINKTLLQVLGLCVSPYFRYSSKCFAEIYRAQYQKTVYLCGALIRRTENSINVWNFGYLGDWL